MTKKDYTREDLIYCLVENEEIQEVNYVKNERKVIGVTTEYYNLLLDEHDRLADENGKLRKDNEEYLNLLYENNILEKPKTQEEINQELLEQNKMLAQQQLEMAQLLKEVRNELKSTRSENTKLKKGVGNKNEHEVTV